ncbi:class I SAM-dependent methyltransferase [Amnibacterium flavum]|uniref:SAM-dependent methyltransferase n=1 Tax=Amnibacterium flavum TaxID=2173173 RepID=A0A2V1HZI7_9MICO|nr:class I SAM-dependent methyltransferase [Amnibacterium flavum]PVZ96184.1 SAM-dependent methyltransferase [Amnibacterium flavum]
MTSHHGHEHTVDTTGLTAAEYWENRYRENGKSWSGNANAALVREVGEVSPGTALDLGAGEGGDALWLARQGWAVTAVDIAPSALAIGAAEQQPGDDITWVAADLSDWQPPRSYDLVSACFLHSFVELPRERILRRAAEAVAPGGLLLIVGHSGVPHWVDPAEFGDHIEELPTPDEMLEALFVDNPRLERGDWTVITSELVERPIVAPDGSDSSIVDSVLKLRRTSAAD